MIVVELRSMPVDSMTHERNEKYRILIGHVYYFGELGLVGKIILKWMLTELGVGI
jgi:hypothetical protein